MCGIAGIVAPNAERHRDSLQRMTDSLAHRGPDGEGSYFFRDCALGHRRLSVVDLGTGRQPMLSAVSPTAITFNGEIYGYLEIRKELSDYPFKTSSDTEVILALYRHYGVDLLRRLPGMFAFALWDDERRELFCARDRFGEKPFFYAFGSGGEFVFASEIKALVASGLVRPQLDRNSLAHYLKKAYIPPHRTIYKNVYVLPPAASLLLKDGVLTVQSYWEMPAPVASISMADAVERFRELMGAAVSKQLIADVEVGAFLSGGLDSSTVVALAAERSTRLKTISYGFGELRSELSYAAEIATRYETSHYEIRDSDFPLADIVRLMARVYDEPFADSSNIPTFLICRHAAKDLQLKVVLTGDGADELLAGYDFWYRRLYRAGRAQSEKSWKLYLAALAVNNLVKTGCPVPGFLRSLSDGFYLNSHGSIAAIHDAQNKYFDEFELAALGFPFIRTAELPAVFGGVDDALRMDLADYMPGDILVKTDRASMANSLELRSPFLDVELASFLIGLPVSLKIDADEDKVILRRAFEGRWTDSIRRRGKQGFGAPVGAWLQRSDMRGLVHDFLLLPGNKIHQYFDSRQIVRIAGAHNYKTWIMLVLSMWMENNELSG